MPRLINKASCVSTVVYTLQVKLWEQSLYIDAGKLIQTRRKRIRVIKFVFQDWHPEYQDDTQLTTHFSSIQQKLHPIDVGTTAQKHSWQTQNLFALVKKKNIGALKNESKMKTVQPVPQLNTDRKRETYVFKTSCSLILDSSRPNPSRVYAIDTVLN